MSATSAPWAMAPVATPAITSGVSKFSMMVRHNSVLINVRTEGYDSVRRLSVYIGEFHPDAQVNGWSGWSFIALTFNNFSARRCSSFFILLYGCLGYLSISRRNLLRDIAKLLNFRQILIPFHQILNHHCQYHTRNTIQPHLHYKFADPFAFFITLQISAFFNNSPYTPIVHISYQSLLINHSIYEKTSNISNITTLVVFMLIQ